MNKADLVHTYSNTSTFFWFNIPVSVCRCCLPNCLKVTRKNRDTYHKQAEEISKCHLLISIINCKPRAVLGFDPAWSKNVTEDQLKLSTLNNTFLLKIVWQVKQRAI